MLDRRESDLVLAAQDGNKSAFGKLVERYQNLVTSIALSRTGDLQRSEDIAQQAFLVAWQKRAELRDPSRFGGWLRSIARNVTLNSNRKSARLDRSAQSLEAQTEPRSLDMPDDDMTKREQQELLWASLKHIPEDYREPLILFYREDQSVQQVADQLGLSVDAVKQRLVRGRAMLKSEVEQFVEDLLGSTKPSPSFASAVLATLPAAGAAAGSAAAKTGIMLGVKSMLGKMGFLVSGPFLGAMGGVLGGAVGVGAAWYGTKSAEKHATSEEEKKLLWWFFRAVLVMTFSITALSLATAFLTAEGLFRLFSVIGVTVGYIIALVSMIIYFINRQRELHEEYGKPAYATEMEFGSPAPLGSYRLALVGTTVGCWTWLFVLAAVKQSWIVLAIGAPLMLGHLSWLLINADSPATGPDQVRFQARSVLHNSLLAGLLIAVAGMFTDLQYGRFSSWMLALFVIGICWVVAASLWYAADKIEKKMEEKGLVS